MSTSLPKVYLASSLTNSDLMEQVANLLQSCLVAEVTVRWWLEKWEPGNIQQLKKFSRQDLTGIMEADLLVLILPGGRGAHVEYGFALGIGVNAIIIGTDEEFNKPYPCAFHQESFDRYVVAKLDPDEIIDIIKNHSTQD